MFFSRGTEKMRIGKFLFHVKHGFLSAERIKKAVSRGTAILFHVERAKMLVSRETSSRSNAQRIRTQEGIAEALAKIN